MPPEPLAPSNGREERQKVSPGFGRCKRRRRGGCRGALKAVASKRTAIRGARKGVQQDLLKKVEGARPTRSIGRRPRWTNSVSRTAPIATSANDGLSFPRRAFQARRSTTEAEADFVERRATAKEDRGNADDGRREDDRPH